MMYVRMLRAITITLSPKSERLDHNMGKFMHTHSRKESACNMPGSAPHIQMHHSCSTGGVVVGVLHPLFLGVYA